MSEKWLYWFPEFGSRKDAKKYISPELGRPPIVVARQVAETDWYRDYWRERLVAVISPDGKQHIFKVEAEYEPSFHATRVKP